MHTKCMHTKETPFKIKKKAWIYKMSINGHLKSGMKIWYLNLDKINKNKTEGSAPPNFHKDQN